MFVISHMTFSFNHSSQSNATEYILKVRTDVVSALSLPVIVIASLLTAVKIPNKLNLFKPKI